VAPLVGGKDAEPGLGERTDLMPPAVPELRKSMEQDQERPVLRPGLDGVQMDAVGRDLPMSHGVPAPPWEAPAGGARLLEVDQPVQRRDVVPLLGQEAPDQRLAVGRQAGALQGVLIILEAVLLALLESFERR